MRILVTGADGFVGKNLLCSLRRDPLLEIRGFVRKDTLAILAEHVGWADAIVHLAGCNRPTIESAFTVDNVDLTSSIAAAVRASARPKRILFASSIQAANDTPYGRSKAAAEDVLRQLADETGVSVHIYRLPNIFGKWCRPNYNSVVATFCHNLVHGMPLHINDPERPLVLAYIDDVVAAFTAELDLPLTSGVRSAEVSPCYRVTVGALAEQLRRIHAMRGIHVAESVGCGLVRCLYATYMSYLEPASFSYGLVKHNDPRGAFVEMLKTHDSGQFSYFTARPGVTRGGHYHHTKSEKFLVVLGRALFRFRHIITGETYSIDVNGDDPCIVDTVPGWAHDITNTGTGELVVMLWANEIFDQSKPDTFAEAIS